MVGQPLGGAHVVTRNSHKEDIEKFLKLQGLPDVVVHVVPKKEAKGAFIQRTFFAGTRVSSSSSGGGGSGGGGGGGSGGSSVLDEAGNGGDEDSGEKLPVCSTNGGTSATPPASCLFVDDDIRELVADAWLRSDRRVHRLLFVRAFG
jgi:hypothetical protein